MCTSHTHILITRILITHAHAHHIKTHTSHAHITHSHTHAPLFSHSVHGKEIVTYEEMVKIEPQVNRPRPIMLVGKPSLGGELRAPIMAFPYLVFSQYLLLPRDNYLISPKGTPINYLLCIPVIFLQRYH